MAIREPNYEAGEIRGDWLRDNLSSYPNKTCFKCVGHWDREFYQEGSVYVLDRARRELQTVDDNGSGGSYGNGYSGIWVLIHPFNNKELEDYL